MENDDRPIGQLLSRRDALKLLGITSAAFLAGCAPGSSNLLTDTPVPTDILEATSPPLSATTVASTAFPACIVRPELTEGPYFVDEKINRSDIRSNPSDGSVKEGLPLQLTFRVSQVNNSCAPLEGATVDIWHCDALGVYSDASDPSFNTIGKKFLRGYQVTDANGVAQFITIYPGWYQGRTVHIHFKIRANDSSGSTYDFTSQLFFDDSLSDMIYTQEPYASKQGTRSPRNDGDNIFGESGDQLTLQLAQTAEGYAATFDIGLQIS
ncbi:MAG: intradiol ring-cleavage dioxygenase [Anaerolineae bacterium]|nr:intradiol ring-cleavage dioxygenase [Anaerolineae bacterium]